MHCVELLGQLLCVSDFDRQITKFHVRVAILNGITALGTPITDGRRIGLSKERGLRPSAVLCNRGQDTENRFCSITKLNGQKISPCEMAIAHWLCQTVIKVDLACFESASLSKLNRRCLAMTAYEARFNIRLAVSSVWHLGRACM
jgi:hypothetical protein